MTKPRPAGGAALLPSRRHAHHPQLLRRALAAVSVLPDPVPPPPCCPPRALPRVARVGGVLLLARVDLPGPVFPQPARLRVPAPPAPRLLRFGGRPALAASLPQRVVDDARDQASLRRLRLPSGRTGR